MKDARIERTKRHLFDDIVFIAIASVLSGGDFWIDMEDFKATAKKENETSYYISTLSKAVSIAHGVRKHWGIENKVHWTLDVVFSEDMCRKRKGNAVQNYSNLNRIA